MKLLFTRFKSDWFNFKDLFFVYPKSLHFAKIDLYLRSLYLFKSPYKMVERGDIYGETPLRAMETIIKELKLSPSDTFFEVGAGRGRALLFAALLSGCKAVAIEKVAGFTSRLNAVIKKFGLSRITTLQEDFILVDYSEATAIYFYGITTSDEVTNRLIKLWKKLPETTQIVTISEPLPGFTLKKQFRIEFPWGEGEAFLQTPSI